MATRDGEHFERAGTGDVELSGTPADLGVLSCWLAVNAQRVEAEGWGQVGEGQGTCRQEADQAPRLLGQPGNARVGGGCGQQAAGCGGGREGKKPSV